jgi:hypothetical protein
MVVRLVACMGEKRKVYMVLVGNPKGKRPLGRQRHRWEEGIRIGLKRDWRGGGVEWIQLAQGRSQWQDLVNTVINLQALAPQSYCAQSS